VKQPSRFITLEGGEGAGKSTQIQRLARRLRRAGIKVLVTREPGGAPGAEAVRRLLLEGRSDRWDPMSEALLHFAARREHLVKTIWPALARGHWVISDRFADSTLAYQGYGQGVGTGKIKTLYKLAVGSFAPDMTLMLDLPAATGLARARSRTPGRDRYERMQLSFHTRLRAAFRKIARAQPRRCVVIDASLSPQAVNDAIWTALTRRFKLGS
jgi:dTMP kinase